MQTSRYYSEYYTVEDWENWKDKWELIHGMPYCMSPAPSGKHQLLSTLISFELVSELRKTNCKKCQVFPPVDWQISEDTIVEPDLLILCTPFDGARLYETPAAVFEITSPSTRNKDRTVKFDLYEWRKVPFYTLVDPVTESFELYALGSDGKYAQPDSGPILTFDLGDCQIQLNIRKVWEALEEGKSVN